MKKSLIIIIAILVVLVGGYVVYDQIFDRREQEKNATNVEINSNTAVATEPVVFTPDPAIQEKLAQIFSDPDLIEESVGMEEAFDRVTSIVGLTDTNRLDLIVQIAYFAENARNMDEAMGSAALFHYYNFSSDEKLKAILPYLGEKDLKIRGMLIDMLGTIDSPQGGEPDFSFYRSVIEAEKLDPPRELIKYMYEVSPKVAVITLANIYVNDSSEIETLRQATEVIQDAIVTLERMGDEEFRRVLPAASEQLGILSQNEAWWVRLYVAEIIRHVPELQTDELLDLLGSDSNELVRESINRADQR